MLTTAKTTKGAITAKMDRPMMWWRAGRAPSTAAAATCRWPARLTRRRKTSSAPSPSAANTANRTSMAPGPRPLISVMMVELAPENSPGTAGIACPIPRKCARMAFDQSIKSLAEAPTGSSSGGGALLVAIHALTSGSSSNFNNCSTFSGGGAVAAGAADWALA